MAALPQDGISNGEQKGSPRSSHSRSVSRSSFERLGSGFRAIQESVSRPAGRSRTPSILESGSGSRRASRSPGQQRSVPRGASPTESSTPPPNRAFPFHVGLTSREDFAYQVSSRTRSRTAQRVLRSRTRQPPHTPTTEREERSSSSSASSALQAGAGVPEAAAHAQARLHRRSSTRSRSPAAGGSTCDGLISMDRGERGALQQGEGSGGYARTLDATEAAAGARAAAQGHAPTSLLLAHRLTDQRRGARSAMPPPPPPQPSLAWGVGGGGPGSHRWSGLALLSALSVAGAAAVFTIEFVRQRESGGGRQHGGQSASPYWSAWSCLFVCASAATGTGLHSRALRGLSTSSLAVLACLAAAGCSVAVSLLPVALRLRHLRSLCRLREPGQWAESERVECEREPGLQGLDRTQRTGTFPPASSSSSSSSGRSTSSAVALPTAAVAAASDFLMPPPEHPALLFGKHGCGAPAAALEALEAEALEAEAAALQVLLCAVLCLAAACIAGGATAIHLLLLSATREQRALFLAGGGGGGGGGGGTTTTSAVFGFAAFTSAAAFANAGLDLTLARGGGGGGGGGYGDGSSSSVAGLAGCVGVLVVAGHAFFPLLLHATLAALHKVAASRACGWPKLAASLGRLRAAQEAPPSCAATATSSSSSSSWGRPSSSRRNHGPLLLGTADAIRLAGHHAGLTAGQFLALSFMGEGVSSGEAIFLALNTRHAGFSSVDLSSQGAAVLVLTLFLMASAPVPLILAMKRSGHDAAQAAADAAEADGAAAPWADEETDAWDGAWAAGGGGGGDDDHGGGDGGGGDGDGDGDGGGALAEPAAAAGQNHERTADGNSADRGGRGMGNSFPGSGGDPGRSGPGPAQPGLVYAAETPQTPPASHAAAAAAAAAGSQRLKAVAKERPEMANPGWWDRAVQAIKGGGEEAENGGGSSDGGGDGACGPQEAPTMSAAAAAAADPASSSSPTLARGNGGEDEGENEGETEGENDEDEDGGEDDGDVVPPLDPATTNSSRKSPRNRPSPRSSAERAHFRSSPRSSVERAHFRSSPRSSAERAHFRSSPRSSAERAHFRSSPRSSAERAHPEPPNGRKSSPRGSRRSSPRASEERARFFHHAEPDVSPVVAAAAGAAPPPPPSAAAASGFSPNRSTSPSSLRRRESAASSMRGTELAAAAAATAVTAAAVVAAPATGEEDEAAAAAAAAAAADVSARGFVESKHAVGEEGEEGGGDGGDEAAERGEGVPWPAKHRGSPSRDKPKQRRHASSTGRTKALRRFILDSALHVRSALRFALPLFASSPSSSSSSVAYARGGGGGGFSGGCAAWDVVVLGVAWFLVVAMQGYGPGPGGDGDDHGSDDHGGGGGSDSFFAPVFHVIFELCSAYGNVGFSMGSRREDGASFSADLTAASQAVIVILMFLGRARSLPLPPPPLSLPQCNPRAPQRLLPRPPFAALAPGSGGFAGATHAPEGCIAGGGPLGTAERVAAGLAEFDEAPNPLQAATAAATPSAAPHNPAPTGKSALGGVLGGPTSGGDSAATSAPSLNKRGGSSVRWSGLEADSALEGIPRPSDDPNRSAMADIFI